MNLFFKCFCFSCIFGNKIVLHQWINWWMLVDWLVGYLSNVEFTFVFWIESVECEYINKYVYGKSKYSSNVNRMSI